MSEINKESVINPDDYVFMMKIGHGNFSELYMVEHKISKILFTLKMFTKMRVEQLRKQEDVLMEKHVMNKITEHENIIKFYGSNKDEVHLYILYEYVNGGELWKKTVVYGITSNKLIKYYFKQVLDGISHMHSFKIVHRDIKPENIMVTKDEKTIKIIDFGSCKDMEGTEFEKKFEEERAKIKNPKPSFKNFVGTPNYMAPECVRNKNSDYRSDMWSLGCLLFQMYVGFPPFLGKSDYLIFIKSTIASFKFPGSVIPPHAKDLISKLIVLEPEKRLTMEEVYQHPYFTSESEEDSTCIKNTDELEFLDNNDDIKPDMRSFFSQDDIVFIKIQKYLSKKYAEFLDISIKLEKIKNYEKMEEECKSQQVEEPYQSEDKNLIPEKATLQGKYDVGLENLQKEISYIIEKINTSEEMKTNVEGRINHLCKQIKHELFKIDYEIQIESN
jgi:serine/threonine protein kinase